MYIPQDPPLVLHRYSQLSLPLLSNDTAPAAGVVGESVVCGSGGGESRVVLAKYWTWHFW